MAGKRAARLKSVQDVNDYLAKPITRVDRDDIDTAKATKIGYLVNILLKGLETGDLEQRVEALEAELQEGNLV